MSKPRMGVWEIVGYDSTTPIFQTKIPSGQITVSQLHALLRALAAKHGLTDEEIVPCFLRRGTKAYLTHLEVRKENDDKQKTTTYSCGSNPFFVARMLRP